VGLSEQKVDHAAIGVCAAKEFHAAAQRLRGGRSEEGFQNNKGVLGNYILLFELKCFGWDTSCIHQD
jgi:hypothetical protein